MTFSLAGRCAATGMVGGVVTTSSPAVGSRCLFTRAGVGVVLTQHWTDPRLGPRGLGLLAEGVPAAAVARALEASAEASEWRQVAVLDAMGGTGCFSGRKIKAPFAEAKGMDCVAVGNILTREGVVGAMVAAFESCPLPFPERLLAALEAGLAAGGEPKPLVSAALQVSWRAPFPYIDLRVDAGVAPIGELRMLWEMFAPGADLYTERALAPLAVARREGR